MKVSEIMTKEVEVISGDVKLDSAARKMRDLDIGMLPISDGERISGILTDRDIVVRSTADGKDPKEVVAGDVASTDIIGCRQDDEVEDVIAKMKQNRVRRIPVIDGDDKLVGVVSLGDVAVEASEGSAGEALEEISSPNRPKR